MSAVRFRSEDHTYWLGERQLPSVTKIVRPAFGYSDEPMAGATGAMALGSRVHELLEWYDQGFVDTEADFETAPYLTGWRRFLSESGFEIEAVEERVHHPTLLYAGTLDRRGKLRGVPAILDIKTGAPNRGVALQLIGYARTFMAHGASATKIPRNLPFHTGTYRRLVVYLRADGTYTCEEFTDHDGDFAAFRGLLAYYQWSHS